MKNLLLFFLLLVVSAGFGQTVLAGKIRDIEDDSELIGATVKIFKCGKLKQWGVSNIDGNYSFSLEAGVYDLEISYTGYATQKIEALLIFPNQKNVKNLVLEMGKGYFGCPQMGYAVPLIKIEDTSTGQTFSSFQLKNYFR